MNKSSSVAFEIAWSVLKSNTLPIRPRVMQYATDPKKTMGLEQTGGVARSARRKLMDEFQAEKNHDHPDSFSEGETDIMNQKGREQTPKEDRYQFEHALEEGIDNMNYVDDDIFQEGHPMYDKDMHRLGFDEYLRQNPHLRGR